MSENKLEELETIETQNDEENEQYEAEPEKSFAEKAGEWVGDHKVETGIGAVVAYYGVKKVVIPTIRKVVNTVVGNKPKEQPKNDDNILKAFAEGRFKFFTIEPRKNEVIAVIENDEDEEETQKETEETPTETEKEPEKGKAVTKKKGK